MYIGLFVGITLWALPESPKWDPCPSAYFRNIERSPSVGDLALFFSNLGPSGAVPELTSEAHPPAHARPPISLLNPKPPSRELTKSGWATERISSTSPLLDAINTPNTKGLGVFIVSRRQDV